MGNNNKKSLNDVIASIASVKANGEFEQSRIDEYCNEPSNLEYENNEDEIDEDNAEKEEVGKGHN